MMRQSNQPRFKTPLKPIGENATSRWRAQISLGFLLLVMVVFSLVSAALLYASRVPVVQQEWSTLLGQEIVVDDNQSDGRTRHLIFIMFTFATPLLLAGVLSTFLGVLRWHRSRQIITERTIID